MRVKGDDFVGNKLLLDTGEQGLPSEGAAVLQLDLVVLSSRQYWSQIRSDSLWALWPADSASLWLQVYAPQVVRRWLFGYQDSTPFLP